MRSLSLGTSNLRRRGGGCLPSPAESRDTCSESAREHHDPRTHRHRPLHHAGRGRAGARRPGGGHQRRLPVRRVAGADPRRHGRRAGDGLRRLDGRAPPRSAHLRHLRGVLAAPHDGRPGRDRPHLQPACPSTSPPAASSTPSGRTRPSSAPMSPGRSTRSGTATPRSTWSAASASCRRSSPRSLFDELRLWVHPVVLGQGRKVFPDGAVPARLRLLEPALTGDGGVVQLRYAPGRARGRELGEMRRDAELTRQKIIGRSSSSSPARSRSTTHRHVVARGVALALVAVDARRPPPRRRTPASRG